MEELSPSSQPPSSLWMTSSTTSLDTDGLVTASLTHPKYAQMPRALYRTTPSLAKYPSKSITKHYQLNDQILTAFESHYEQRNLWHVAYAMGLQFVEMALLEIPKHDYYYSPRHERERMNSSLEAVRVANLLKEIQEQGRDDYSPALAANSNDSSNNINNNDINTGVFVTVSDEQKQRVEQLQELAVRSVEQASEDQYETYRARTERDIRSSLISPTGGGGLKGGDHHQSSQPQTLSASGGGSNSGHHGHNATGGGAMGMMADWVVLDPLLMCQDSLTAVLCPSSAGKLEALSEDNNTITISNQQAALWEQAGSQSPLLHEFRSFSSASSTTGFSASATTATGRTSTPAGVPSVVGPAPRDRIEALRAATSSASSQSSQSTTKSRRSNLDPPADIEIRDETGTREIRRDDTTTSHSSATAKHKNNSRAATVATPAAAAATATRATTPVVASQPLLQRQIDAHHLSTAIPLVKSSTAPHRKSSLSSLGSDNDGQQAAAAGLSNTTSTTTTASSSGSVGGKRASHARQSSWSFVAPPASLDAQHSWGSPPPLVAQENLTKAREDNHHHHHHHRSKKKTASKEQATTPTAAAAATPRPPLPPSSSSQRRGSSIPEVDDWMLVRRTNSQSSLMSTVSDSQRQQQQREESPAPHHRHSRTSTAEAMMLERALFLSGLEVVDAATIEAATAAAGTPTASEPELISTLTAEKEPPPPMRLSTTSKLEFSTLSTLYHEDYDHLFRTNRIRVTTADTYQGRFPESTNGCTVIAPLLCMHHLLNETADAAAAPDYGVSDTEIVQVIDEETPVILGELRTNLGLSDQAFLIPADVHDYLIENGQFHQTQFVNVVGGNLLQDEHLANFVEALADKAHPKLAATLFFHEHVVAILKLDRGDGKFWYDCIDSLPLPETLQHLDESEEDFWDRMGIRRDDPRLTQVLVPFSVRFRCVDEEALQACLRWYACSKFTEENIRYIDQYDWQDAQSDFDPRVFQAFLWGRPQA